MRSNTIIIVKEVISGGLLLVVDGIPMIFNGNNLNGILQVVGADGLDDGITYRVVIREGVHYYKFDQDFRFIDAIASSTQTLCDTWFGLASTIGAKDDELKKFLCAYSPSDADILNATDVAFKMFK